MEPRPPSLPHVDAVGIVRYPNGHEGKARAYSSRVKAMAWAMLLVFGLVVVVSTGVSLGTYCLTSDGANLTDLQPWLQSAAR